MKNKKQLFFGIFRVLFYSGLYLTFLIIPLSVLIEKSLCFTYSEFHLVCPACGITRAFGHIMHGKIALAFRYHSLFTCCIFPISTFLFVQDTITVIKRWRKQPTKASIIETLLGGM
ncbi:MAG: DUF2752 domain-containing protein [Bacilli bacterium]